MFRKAELEQLRLRKDLLVRQCDTNRLLLASEWQRVRSPEFWWSEASSSVRKHPLLTAGLGIAAGVLAIQLLRQPGPMIRWFSRIIGASSAVSSIWKLFGGGDRRE